MSVVYWPTEQLHWKGYTMLLVSSIYIEYSHKSYQGKKEDRRVIERIDTALCQSKETGFQSKRNHWYLEEHIEWTRTAIEEEHEKDSQEFLE